MKARVKRKGADLTVRTGPKATLAMLRTELHRLLHQKEEIADTLLCALLCSGHLLFEDVPGVGKTTLIKAVAKLLGLEMARVQCTSDLLPSDILGVEVFSTEKEQFAFHKGPIFSNIVFVDELNRCSPRTQSALLEAMAEGIVTLNRTTYTLPNPFVVFATQNPSDFVGTYPLPESQLDRFAAKIHLNYPSSNREKEIFMRSAADPISDVPQLNLGPELLSEMQSSTEQVHVEARVVDYVKRFIDATRNHPAIRLGVSTRGGVIWVRMAKAHAAINGRDYVTPDDLHALAIPCLLHRLVSRNGADALPVLQEILSSIPIENVL